MTANLIKLLIALFTFAVAAPLTQQLARGQANVAQALNQEASLNVTGKSLKVVLADLGRDHGISIEMSDDAANFLPLGSATRVTARIDNLPVGDLVYALVSPLGMDMLVGDNGVKIVPGDVLLRLGRRATADEMQTYEALRKLEPGSSEADLDTLVQMIQFAVPQSDARTKLTQAIERVGAGPADEVLTVACESLDWSWTLAGNHVEIVPASQAVARRLDMPITVRLNNRMLMEVLQAIGRELGMRITVEEGLIPSLPPGMQRNFSLNVLNLPAVEALDLVAAQTGMSYLLNEDGVYFYRERESPDSASESSASGSRAGSASRDPYIAQYIHKLDDGFEVHWLIRQSDVPDAVLELRTRDLEHFNEMLLKLAEDEGIDVKP